VIRLSLIVVMILLVGCNLATNRQNLDGKRSFESAQYNQALNSFHLALNANPANPDAHYNIGRTLHKLSERSKDKNQIQQAETAYRQALRLNPSHIEANRGLSVLLAENKRSPEAFALIQNWSSFEPSSAEPKIELARLYAEHGDRKTATQLLSDALSADFENDRALRAIGMLREQAGDYQQALIDYQRSLQLNPIQPELSNHVARLQSQNPNFYQAVPQSPNRTASIAPGWPKF